MDYHHIGVACRDIKRTREFLMTLFPDAKISEVIYDPLQKVEVCLLSINKFFQIELVSGLLVKSIVEKGNSYYHICFTVNEIDEAIELLKQKGAIVVSEPKPAILFDNKKVAFIFTEIGLIELLEEQI